MNPLFSTFSLNQADGDPVTLGWNAMSAFGQSSCRLNNAEKVAEFVAEFVAENRHSKTVAPSFLSSFWTTLSTPLLSSEMISACR